MLKIKIAFQTLTATAWFYAIVLMFGLVTAACTPQPTLPINNAYGTPVPQGNTAAHDEIVGYFAAQTRMFASPTALPPTLTPLPVETVTLGTGDVQITLRWRTYADLDLHVTDPFGETINFTNRIAGSQGQLDVDANFSPCAQTLSPVENVFFPTGSSPHGQFRVQVHYHPTCGNRGAADYEVTVNRTGQQPEVFTGRLTTPDQWAEVTTFTF